MNDPRIGIPGERPQTTISGKPYEYPNVTLVKLGGGYRCALDAAPSPDQNAIVEQLRQKVAAELAPKPVPERKSRKPAQEDAHEDA